jgi:hypothetical protein
MAFQPDRLVLDLRRCSGGTPHRYPKRVMPLLGPGAKV